jgi:hypothetical protein
MDRSKSLTSPQDVEQYCTGQYEPKAENTAAQDIDRAGTAYGRQVHKLVASMKKNAVSLIPMKIEHALLHLRANGPTRASSAYNTLKPENTLNWWGTFGDLVPYTFGPEHVNAMSNNSYSSTFTGVLIDFFRVHQIDSYYTKANADFT